MRLLFRERQLVPIPERALPATAFQPHVKPRAQARTLRGQQAALLGGWGVRGSEHRHRALCWLPMGATHPLGGDPAVLPPRHPDSHGRRCDPAAHGRWHVLDGRSGHVLRPHVHAHETDGGLAAPTTASEISGESRVASVGDRGRLGASETRNVGDASHTYGVGTGPPLGPAHGAARHRTTGRTPTAVCPACFLRVSVSNMI